MNLDQVIAEIKKSGSENIKKIFMRHGAKEPVYGVKIEDLKKIQKKIKDNQQTIASGLFESGIGDAQYLAGLMADGSKMTKKELQAWAEKSDWPMISENAVAWVAGENKDAFGLALKWIDSKKENVASTGWATISSIVSTWPDEKLDIPALKKLLQRTQKEIHDAPNRVRSTMNGFVIAAGSYVAALTQDALDTAKKNGTITVIKEGTNCKTAFAPDYINKAIKKDGIAKKKKTAKC